MKYFHSTLWFTTLLCGVVLIAFVIKLMDNTYWELAISSIITFLCAIIIYVQQNKHSEHIAERERRKMNYDTTKALLCKIEASLNIYRRFESLICMLDPSKDIRSIIADVVHLQDDIDVTINEFRIHKEKINSHEKLIIYERKLSTIVNAYHKVFDGFKSEIVVKLNDLQNTAETTLYAAEQIGTQTDKLKLVIALRQKQEYINNSKTKFLNLLSRQEANINKMRSALSEAKDMLLQAEYELIDK